MNLSFPRVSLVTILLTVAVSISTANAQSGPPAAGKLWEVVSQTSMVGMPMKIPAQTQQVCAPLEWTEPPGSGNEERDCVNSDFLRDDDNTVTWTSTCTGPRAMTGKGKITFDGDDAYSGKLKYTYGAGDVIISLTGHVIGTCDNPQ